MLTLSPGQIAIIAALVALLMLTGMGNDGMNFLSRRHDG